MRRFSSGLIDRLSTSDGIFGGQQFGAAPTGLRHCNTVHSAVGLA